MSEPPVTKYELTVKIRGNTHDEIEDELLTLTRGGYLLDSDYGKRDAWNSTGGRCTSVMVHTNPEQTPEKYAEELDAWWNEHKAARREARTWPDWRTHGYSEMSVGETRFGTFGDLMQWMQ